MAEERTIRVTGRGELRVKPDTVRLTLTIGRTEPDFAAAVDAAEKASAAAVAALAEAGAAGKDVRALSLRTEPHYETIADENGVRTRKFAGYSAVRRIRAELGTDPAALGRALTLLAACGAAQCIVLFGGSLLFIDFCFPAPAAGYPLCLAAMILTDLAMTAIGLFLSALLKKQESAILPVLLLIIVQVVFCDSLIRLDGAAGLIKYITPAAWGTAVFGKACGLNGWSEWFSRPLYGVNPLISLAALAAITALFVLLTAAKLRRTYRHKD